MENNYDIKLKVGQTAYFFLPNKLEVKKIEISEIGITEKGIIYWYCEYGNRFSVNYDLFDNYQACFISGMENLIEKTTSDLYRYKRILKSHKEGSGDEH